MKNFARVLLIISFVFSGALLAGAQQSAQSSAAKNQQSKTVTPKRHAPVVWTNDNITSVRSTADDYQIEQAREKQAQQAAAQKAAAAAAAKKSANAAWASPQVKTTQQADQMIEQRSRALSAEQGYVQRVEKELANSKATGSEKERLEWRLKSHSVTAQHLQSQIKQLQAERAAIAKKSSKGQ